MKLRFAALGSTCLIFLSLVLYRGLLAQDAELLPDHPGTLSVTTDVVLVPVVVMDRKYQFVSGLQKEDFKIYDEHVQQKVLYFTSEDAPVSVNLLIDTSGSMAGKLELSRMAVREFLKASNPEDEFSLIAFNGGAHLLSPFTADHALLTNWLPLLQARGWTALLDAMDLALTQVKNARYPRKAIFLISDGGDNRSRHTETEVQRRLTEANVQVYSIGIFSRFEPDDQNGAPLLKRVAKLTGGRLFKIDDPNALPETAGTIGMALRHQYVLGYIPSDAKSDGRYHHIEVKLAQPNRFPKLTISSRSSYLAPLE